MQQQSVPQRDQDRGEGVWWKVHQLLVLHRLADPFPQHAAPGRDARREGIPHRPLVADGGPQVRQHLDVSGIPGALQHCPGKGLQPLHAPRYALQGLEDCQPPGCLILQQRNKKLLLAPEVAVEASLAHPRLFADLVDGELAEPLPTRASPGCLDDVVAPLLLLLRSQHRHGPHRPFEIVEN